MTVSTTERNPAAMKLADLARCKGIRPFQAGDEELLCGSCLIPIESRGLAGFQHDPAYIRRLREMTDDGRWPND